MVGWLCVDQVVGMGVVVMGVELGVGVVVGMGVVVVGGMGVVVVGGVVVGVGWGVPSQTPSNGQRRPLASCWPGPPLGL